MVTPDYASLDAAESWRETAKLVRQLLRLRNRGLIVYNNDRWSAVEKV